jgi:hypothetical protein
LNEGQENEAGWWEFELLQWRRQEEDIEVRKEMAITKAIQRTELAVPKIKNFSPPLKSLI